MAAAIAAILQPTMRNVTVRRTVSNDRGPIENCHSRPPTPRCIRTLHTCGQRLRGFLRRLFPGIRRTEQAGAMFPLLPPQARRDPRFPRDPRGSAPTRPGLQQAMHSHGPAVLRRDVGHVSLAFREPKSATRSWGRRATAGADAALREPSADGREAPSPVVRACSRASVSTCAEGSRGRSRGVR